MEQTSEYVFISLYGEATISSFIFSSSFESMLALVVVLQLCTLTVLFNLKTPSNVKSILVKMLKLSNFDLYKTETIYTQVFGFLNTEAFNQLFESAGFDTTNFIIGIGPIFISVIVFPVWRMVQLIMRWILHCSFIPSRIKRKPKPWFVVANEFIRVVCLEFSLSALISLKMTPKETLHLPAEFF